jgi:anti-sigma B factor antagonist
MERADLRVSVAHGDEETVVALAGELDISTAEQLSETINGELRGGRVRIVVDLADLTFCDSLGLGTLVVLSRSARIQQTYLLLRNPSPFFTRMLEVTGVGAGLNIAED